MSSFSSTQFLSVYQTYLELLRWRLSTKPRYVLMIAESYCVKPPTPACSDLDLLAEDGDDHHDSPVCFACSRRERRSQWQKEITEDGHECAGSNNINMTSTSWHNHNYLGHHHNNNIDDPPHHYLISSSWTRLCRGGSGEEGYVPTAYLQWLT